jgi:hypothetical protein
MSFRIPLQGIGASGIAAETSMASAENAATGRHGKKFRPQRRSGQRSSAPFRCDDLDQLVRLHRKLAFKLKYPAARALRQKESSMAVDPALSIESAPPSPMKSYSPVVVRDIESPMAPLTAISSGISFDNCSSLPRRCTD